MCPIIVWLVTGPSSSNWPYITLATTVLYSLIQLGTVPSAFGTKYEVCPSCVFRSTSLKSQKRRNGLIATPCNTLDEIIKLEVAMWHCYIREVAADCGTYRASTIRHTVYGGADVARFLMFRNNYSRWPKHNYRTKMSPRPPSNSMFVSDVSHDVTHGNLTSDNLEP